jgi:hypothetical protein
VLKVFTKGGIDTTTTEIWGNVLHFLYSGTAPTNAVLSTMAAAVSGFWGTHMAPECPSPTALTSVQITDLTSDTAAEGTWTGVIPGTRGDDSIAANGSVLISYPTALRYKGGHPRTYLYVLGNADFLGAMEWSTAATAEVQTHWQAFLTAIVGYTASGMTVSEMVTVRMHGKYLPNSGAPHYYLTTPLISPVVIAQATAHQQIASQRRRIGRARH